MPDSKNTDNENKTEKPKNTTSRVNKASLVKYSLIVFNVLFFGLFLSQLYIFVSHNSEKASNIINDGRKITLTVKSSEIELTELPLDQMPEQMMPKEEEVVIDEEQGPAIPEEVEKEEEVIEEEIAEEEEKPIVVDYNTANLSIILTEVGLKQEMLEYAKKLPKEVTFAFSPYSDEIQNKINSTKEDGREVLLNLMFEPSKYPLTDTGPLTIQSHFEETQNIYRLQNTINEKSGFSGYLTNTDEIITHNLEVISPVLLNIKEQNKFFMFYKLPVNSYLEKEAKPMAVDIGAVNYLIDETPTIEHITNSLNNVKKELLEKKGKIVVAMRPYKNSIDTVDKWLKDNLGPNLQIAPISYFVTDN